MMGPPRRRWSARDVEEDLRDYLHRLEIELAGVRRELDARVGRDNRAD
jgi:hypothetical protein